MFSVNNVSEGRETVTVTSEAVEMLLVYRWMYTQERSVLVAGNCLTSDPQIRKLNRFAAAIVRAQRVCGKHAGVMALLACMSPCWLCEG